MAKGIRAANPIWYFVDLTGLGLNDQYYINFLTNTFPYLPQPVFHDVNLTVPWTDPLQFFPNGTLPDNMYWDPELTWRLEIRQGPTQSDPLIYEINNFMPGVGGSVTPTNLQILTGDNQITNPQFSEIFFASPYTITTAGTYNIAPGWDLILTGSGSTTLTQLILTGASVTVDPNGNSIPYALKIDNAGWTTAILQQRLNNNGALWAGGAVGGLLVARSEGSNETITMHYVPSSGATDNTILTANLTTGNFAVFSDGINIPTPSTNTDLSSVAFVNINIVLPTTGIVDLSDIQLTGQNEPLPQFPLLPSQKPVLIEETIERGIDHTFHVYKNDLIEHAKETLLTGWNFPLNPFQFITTTVTLATAITSYIADQTILFQNSGSNLLTGKAPVAQRFGLEIKAQTASIDTRFALIQYIDPSTIEPYWSYILSSLVRARLFTTHGTQCRFKMRLIYRASLPPTLSNVEPIVSLTGTDPVFAAGWTAIAPINDPAYLLPNSYDGATNSYPAFSFDQFQLPDSSNANMTLGIVIYTLDQLNSTAASEDVIIFDKISLTPTEYAIDASTETFDESLRKCQFYYEKSYAYNVLPAAMTSLNSKLVRLNKPFDYTTSKSILRLGSFEIEYCQTKRDIPIINILSPTSGGSDIALASIARDGSNPAPVTPPNPAQETVSTNWNTTYISVNRAIFICSNTTTTALELAVGNIGDEALLNFHYTCDSRMGL